jgi:hypothetical protein
MAKDIISDILGSIYGTISNSIEDVLAAISNIAAFASAIWALIGLLQLISANGLVSGFAIYLAIGVVTSLITGIFAEILNSTIPSPLKWGVQLIEEILKIIGAI